jgi:hypothetical protein
MLSRFPVGKKNRMGVGCVRRWKIDGVLKSSGEARDETPRNVGFHRGCPNLIFNGGESCGVLRWQSEDLRQSGEWHYTGFGTSSSGRPLSLFAR